MYSFSSLSLRDILHCQFSVIIKLTATWPNKKQGQNVRVKATILLFLSRESSTTIIYEDLKGKHIFAKINVFDIFSQFSDRVIWMVQNHKKTLTIDITKF